ncbi:xaa-Arg dipeptidase [Erythrolamprus reginae]|uniref:xaa-Arg dipeptidase n=1 Tax=Erythrolamprus reginae TaxID=121349 RepID=UPI00396C690A
MRPNEAKEASSASEMRLDEWKRRAAECIDESSQRLGELSREIWSHPELSHEEHRAHATLTRFFAGLPVSSSSGAWSVQRSYKLETAFRADWKWDGAPGFPAEGSPAFPQTLRLGFLCEYDALPNIGHACGHNLIAEVGAAAALGLKGALESLRQSPAGLSRQMPAVEVTVLGTPAEEDGGGKIDLIKAGAFDNLDVVFMAHPSQEDSSYLPDIAEHDVTVKYYGKDSHAAAYPWEGLNALDAAVLAYNNLSLLRQQMKPTWRVHGIIKNGGVKPNIIPSYTELEFYLRAPSLRELSTLKEKAVNCFKAAALATGCEVDLHHSETDFYNVLPNKTLEKMYKENGKKLGIDFISDDSLNEVTGSTDFGNVSFVVPGIHSYFYIGSDALNHTEQYTTAAGSEEAQFYALRTAKALAMTALDVIFKPDMLEKVREDFRLIKLKEDGHLKVPGNAKGPDNGDGAECASH